MSLEAVERFVDPYEVIAEPQLGLAFVPEVGICVPPMSIKEEHELIDQLEEDMTLHLDTLELKPIHHFGPGVYMRELTIPAGTLLTGEIHKTEHFCVVLKGLISVWTAGEGVRWVEGPATFLSKPGARRVGWAIEDTVWTTIHPTALTDLNEIEKEIFDKRPSPTDRIHEADRKDYEYFLWEYGFTHGSIARLVENEDDQIPMPNDVNTIELRESPIAGWGMFFTQDLPANTVFAPGRMNGKRTPAGRYINHSMRPNSIMAALGSGDLVLKTIRAVRRGTEVLIDYRQAMKVNGTGLKPVRRITP